MRHAPLDVTILALLILAPSTSRAGSYVFSVCPGQAVESAQLGLTMGKLMPYVGFDILGVAAKAKYTYVDEFTYNGDVYRSEETDDLKGSATLLIPHVGARYYCGNSEVRPYLFGDFLKSFAFVNTTDDYSARDFVNGSLTNSASGSDELSERIKDQVQKALGFWGLSAGFGCEYAFSDHFRLGGEYALRYFHTSTKSESSSGGGAGESYSSLYNDELSASLKLSTGRVWLNYQF